MKSILNILFFIPFFFLSCGSNEESNLQIAASANMQFPMEEIIAAFEKETGVKCELIIGSSGKLAAQIREGAPFDIFISADLETPKALYSSGFSDGEPKIYANGALVLWTCISNEIPSLDELRTDKFNFIAIGNPETAPYGKAAKEALVNYGIYDQISFKLVYGESITQTNQMIEFGAADIGITSLSTVKSAPLSSTGLWTAIDPVLYSPITQAAIMIKREKKHPDAELFYSFLFSETSKKILSNYGYEY